MVISSCSDLSKLSPKIRHVHFRKSLSKRAIERALLLCKRLESISMSDYAYKRCAEVTIDLIETKGINIIIVRKSAGRPNLIERIR